MGNQGPHFSVGDQDESSAGVARSGRRSYEEARACGDPERWLAIWEQPPGDQGEVLDRAFIHKSLSLRGRIVPDARRGSDGLPQG
jgi:hypothetical protein